MSSAKKVPTPGREPPLQLRPGPELGQLINEFATRHSLGANEACKRLVSLAVTAMDSRHYALVGGLADSMGGANAFVRACIYVQGRVDGAALASPRFRAEPDRSLFIVKVVKDFLEGKGLELPESSLNFLADQATRHTEVEEPERSHEGAEAEMSSRARIATGMNPTSKKAPQKRPKPDLSASRYRESEAEREEKEREEEERSRVEPERERLLERN